MHKFYFTIFFSILGSSHLQACSSSSMARTVKSWTPTILKISLATVALKPWQIIPRLFTDIDKLKSDYKDSYKKYGAILAVNTTYLNRQSPDPFRPSFEQISQAEQTVAPDLANCSLSKLSNLLIKQTNFNINEPSSNIHPSYTPRDSHDLTRIDQKAWDAQKAIVESIKNACNALDITRLQASSSEDCFAKKFKTLRETYEAARQKLKIEDKARNDLIRHYQIAGILGTYSLPFYMAARKNYLSPIKACIAAAGVGATLVSAFIIYAVNKIDDRHPVNR